MILQPPTRAQHGREVLSHFTMGKLRPQALIFKAMQLWLGPLPAEKARYSHPSRVPAPHSHLTPRPGDCPSSQSLRPLVPATHYLNHSEGGQSLHGRPEQRHVGSLHNGTLGTAACSSTQVGVSILSARAQTAIAKQIRLPALCASLVLCSSAVQWWTEQGLSHCRAQAAAFRCHSL